jgi:hypothetical protein
MVSHEVRNIREHGDIICELSVWCDTVHPYKLLRIISTGISSTFPLKMSFISHDPAYIVI